jgi:hypothetical protein
MLEHLAYYGTLTDEQIQELATDENGTIDAELTLRVMLERDMCREVNQNVLKELLELAKQREEEEEANEKKNNNNGTTN